MKLKPTENQYRWGIVAFLVLAATSLFVAMLLNLGSIWGSIKTIISLLVPFIIGFAIAYLLNPIMKFWEEKVLKKIKKPQTRRTLSLLITYAAFLLLLGGAISYVAPRLISSITSLANEIPGYYNTFVKDATDFIEAHPSINQLYTRYEMQIHSFLEQCVSFISGYLGELVPKIANVTMKVGSGLINTFVGIVISVYFLHGKEKLIAQSKKVLNFVFKKESSYRRVLNVAQVTHEKTLNYLTARLLDSLIVAVIAYVVMSIMRLPYALLCALIIAVFNTIPYFGSWIGAVPPAIIVLIFKPTMLIPYLIFIVVLEQIDGNIIGPRIQGKQLGLSALWIIFAIFLFGGLFGFVGMVLGVPIFAVIYYFLNAAINNGLNKQGKSANTLDYAPPEARQIIVEESKKDE
ncbi:MAG: AI-2E family transporter [Clostridia bacterium]|nr:AI-2E family transporter [Clostridia bacterium]